MDEFDPDEYVGEGLLTLFGIEVDNNQYFYNEVFVLGHLKVDESKSVKKDGGSIEKFPSMGKLIEESR